MQTCADAGAGVEGRRVRLPARLVEEALAGGASQAGIRRLGAATPHRSSWPGPGRGSAPARTACTSPIRGRSDAPPRAPRRRRAPGRARRAAAEHRLRHVDGAARGRRRSRWSSCSSPRCCVARTSPSSSRAPSAAPRSHDAGHGGGLRRGRQHRLPRHVLAAAHAGRSPATRRWLRRPAGCRWSRAGGLGRLAGAARSLASCVRWPTPRCSPASSSISSPPRRALRLRRRDRGPQHEHLSSMSTTRRACSWATRRTWTWSPGTGCRAGPTPATPTASCWTSSGRSSWASTILARSPGPPCCTTSATSIRPAEALEGMVLGDEMAGYARALLRDVRSTTIPRPGRDPGRRPRRQPPRQHDPAAPRGFWRRRCSTRTRTTAGPADGAHDCSSRVRARLHELLAARPAFALDADAGRRPRPLLAGPLRPGRASLTYHGRPGRPPTKGASMSHRS